MKQGLESVIRTTNAVSVAKTLFFVISVGFTVMSAFAGRPDSVMKDPKALEQYMDKRFDHSTGFEGRYQELGAQMSKVVRQLNPDTKPFDEERLGHYTDMAIRTLNHSKAYQHEYNDALVKMHLTAVSFAKQHNMVADLVKSDLDTTEYMLKRIASVIKTTGRKDYALRAIVEQTTCFYQLVDDLKWTSDTSVTYTSPFGHVLAVSKKIGIFENLTEEEVHNTYIIPRYMAYAEVLGVKLNVSPLGADSKVTISVAE